VPLVEITLPPNACVLPEAVEALLREAETRIDAYVRSHNGGAVAFLPSQFATV
jgi:hypothetical protein